MLHINNSKCVIKSVINLTGHAFPYCLFMLASVSRARKKQQSDH